jgi:hypothetical protein
MTPTCSFVMRGLVPSIQGNRLDGRIESGHDTQTHHSFVMRGLVPRIQGNLLDGRIESGHDGAYARRLIS